MTGAELIAVERERQITTEGWTSTHDDMHTVGQLSLAAASYAIPPDHRNPDDAPVLWPWDIEWWKPTENRVRELAKAGALIAAEIDRLQRAAAGKQVRP